MWSIWFYFMPNGIEFQAIGFESAEAARDAVDMQVWYRDEGDNTCMINAELKKTAVIKICQT